MHLEAIQRITAIEKACDTHALLYRGVSYWPLCRLKLWAALMKEMVLAKKDEAAASVANTGPTWAAVDQVNIERAGPPELALMRAAGTATPPLKNARALFFLRPEEYGDKVGGTSFAKMLDSVYERTIPRHVSAKIELADARTLAFTRRYPSFFLDPAQTGRDLTFDPPGAMENFAAVSAAAQSVDCTLDAASLTTDMGKIFYYARIFEKVLRRVKPAALFLSVYYHPIGMAWMLACRWAGVRSVDLQHGRLGPLHGLYTQLTAAPAGGYELMPDVVWCWGARTKHDIEVDKAPACTRHGGVVGGNAWLHKWRFGDTAGLEPAEAQDFVARIAQQRKILVSLQPLDSPVGPELLSAMKRSPPDWLWLLRVHPLRRHTIPDIIAILKREGIANFEMNLASGLPLFTLLRMADHHVTVFSSVAVEAASFDVKTSLLGQEGLQAFTPQVDRGIFRYTPQAEALLAHITAVLAAPREPIADDFIDMTPGLIDVTIDNLLEPPSQG